MRAYVLKDHTHLVIEMCAFKISNIKALKGALANSHSKVGVHAASTHRMPSSLERSEIEVSSIVPLISVEHILAKEHPQLSMRCDAVHGRYLVVAVGCHFGAGDVVLHEPAFAWFDYKSSKSDVDIVRLMRCREGITEVQMLSSFLQLEPSWSNFGRHCAGAHSGSPVTSTADAQVPVDAAQPPAQPVTATGLQLIAPAVHWNGFQTTVCMPGSDQQMHLELCALVCSMLNHSCEPNVNYETVWDADNKCPAQRFTALRRIEAGEPLFHSYIDPNADVIDRNLRLKAGYGFECDCGKCRREKAAVHAPAGSGAVGGDQAELPALA